MSEFKRRTKGKPWPTFGTKSITLNKGVDSNNQGYKYCTVIDEYMPTKGVKMIVYKCYRIDFWSNMEYFC